MSTPELSSLSTRRTPSRPGRIARGLWQLGLPGIILAVAGCGGAEPPPATRRIVVVGVDGATWSIVSPMMTAGRLPHMARQYREGSAGLLRSLRAPGSGEPGEPLDPATLWTTLATGMPPGAHGVTGSAERIPGRYELRPMTADRRRAAALWTLAGARGFTVGVAGWPVTFPAERVAGFMIAEGYDPPVTGQRGYIHPPGALGDGDSEGEPLDLPDSAAAVAALDTELEASFTRDLRTLSRFLALYRVWQPRLAFVRFESVDRASHMFWQHYETRYRQLEASRGVAPDPARAESLARAIPGAYEYLDHWIGILLDRLPEGSTLLLVSPYGFRGVGMIDSIHLELDRLLGLLDLERRLPDGAIDMGATKLFCLDGTATMRRDLFLNIRERDESGSVDPVAAPDLRETVVESLRDLKSEKGEPLFRSVDAVDSNEPGEPDVEAIENLGLDPSGEIDVRGTRHRLTSLYRRFSEDFGTHDANGVLLASGGGIEEGRTGWSADLYDIAPTILRLLGMGTVPGMPGAPIAEILKESAPEEHAPPLLEPVPVAPDPVRRSDAILKEEIRRMRAVSHLR